MLKIKALLAKITAKLVTLEADVSPIGTIVTKQATAAVSMANETATIVVSITLTAGKWLVIGSLQFSSTGTTNCYKSASINTGSTGSSNINGKFQVQATGITCLSPSRVLTLTGSTQVNLVGVHYYGSSLNTAGGANLPSITAIRIK